MRQMDFMSTDLHPAGAAQFRSLINRMRPRVFHDGGKKFSLYPFEGFRLPQRQVHLLTVTKTTKAGPWESAHQYGLAVDFAGIRIGQNGLVKSGDWFWPNAEHVCWGELKSAARALKLDIPIAWDNGHVEHPAFRLLRDTMRDTSREWNWIA